MKRKAVKNKRIGGNTASIKKRLEGSALVLARKYDLDFLIIFGSHARGIARTNSDIDVGFLASIDFRKELSLFGELAEILGTNFVDAVNLDSVSPLLAYIASRDAIVIFEREAGIFANFRTLAFKRFVETKNLREINFGRTMQYIREYSTSII